MKKKKVSTRPLSDLSQIHGAVATPSVNKYLTGYDTETPEDYISKLERMESADLYDHAISVGEVPIDDKSRLIDRLHVRFLQTRAAAIPRTNIPINLDPKKEEAFRKIMAGAR